MNRLWCIFNPTRVELPKGSIMEIYQIVHMQSHTGYMAKKTSQNIHMDEKITRSSKMKSLGAHACHKSPKDTCTCIRQERIETWQRDENCNFVELWFRAIKGTKILFFQLDRRTLFRAESNAPTAEAMALMGLPPSHWRHFHSSMLMIPSNFRYSPVSSRPQTKVLKGSRHGLRWITLLFLCWNTSHWGLHSKVDCGGNLGCW